MADLFDEIEGSKNTSIGQKVRDIGGDLFDEAGIKNKDQSLINPELANAAVDSERERLFADLNSEMSGLDSFLVAAGRGLTTLGRGAGVASPEDEPTSRGFAGLQEARPIATGAGEIVGEAAPFLAPGIGVGALAGQTARVAASGLLGALEGGLITKGKGGDIGDVAIGSGVGGAIAGGAEVLFPVLGRLGRKLMERAGKKARGPLLTREGQPTPQLQSALDETGTTFDQLTNDAIDFVGRQREGASPQEAARLARFKSQGIPATAGDIGQDFAQQADEQRLLSMASGEAGEPLRQLKLTQSEAFKEQAELLVDELGVPKSTGDSLKSALSGRKKLLKKQKNALYKEAAENAPEIRNLPLITDTIEESIPATASFRRISRLAPNQAGALDDLLIEFGVKKTDDVVQEGVDITPLSLDNFEEFRQALNVIERSDQSGAIKVLTGPIKESLDEEADIIFGGLQKAGIVDEDILAPLKEARATVRQIKTEFSPQAITGRLIDVKRDGVTPIIEASKVADNLLAPNAPIENLQKTLSSLSKAGDEGKKAIGDLQASIVLRALDDSLKAPSRKTAGIETIGASQFVKSLSKFGDDKLDLLFKGNPKALDRLRGLQQTARDITPASAATPKGSAPVILDMMKRMGRVPGLAAVVDTVKFIVNAGADDRAVMRAINAKPVFKRSIKAIQNDFPALASSLGIAGIGQIEDEQ